MTARKLLLAGFALCVLATTAFGAGYASLKDIRYAPQRQDIPSDDPTQDRILDIWFPEGEAPAKGWPVVMFIHGGGFSGGDKAMSSGLAPLFNGMLAKGYAVVSINYCLTRKNDKSVRVSCSQQMKDGFPPSGHYHPALQKAIDDACTDASLALGWIDRNGRKYKLDRKRIAVMGGSAGAITCLYTTFVHTPKRPAIKAVVNCWGAINDVSLIRKGSIPVLTFHGDKDALINVCYGEAIQKRLEELGSSASRFIFMEGKGHAQYKYVGQSLIGEVTGFLDEVL